MLMVSFFLETKGNAFPMTIKVSHITFETLEKTINTTEVLNLKLNTRVSILQDVIVEGKLFDVEEKQDSLIYNLNKLLNGSELLLKDVIAKLPGLSIDANGKIRHNGSIIDHLLIDGDEFFQENHQIATENLTSEMIKNIVLLKNYQDFSSIKGFEDSGKSALNISIKDEFKEHYKGNVAVESGLKERYGLNNNLYNFGKINKFNLLTNSNNLNKTIFNLSDYLEMRNVTGKKSIEEQFSNGNFSSTDNDLPPFLFSTDNINTKDLQNATLHFSKKLNKKERVELISIFNHTRQTEKTESFQSYFDNPNTNAVNSEEIRGKSLYNSNVFKYENKFNENTYLKLNSYFLKSIDHQNENLSNLLLSNQTEKEFINSSKLNSTKFGLNTYFKNKFSAKVLFESTFFYDYMTTNTLKHFDSNLVFDWFNHDKNNFNQDNKLDWMSFGAQAKATLQLKKGGISFKLLSFVENETIENQNSIGTDYTFLDRFIKTENNFDIKYNSNYFDQKLNYSIGLNLNNNKYTLSSKFAEQINVALPYASISYKLTTKTTVSTSYRTSLASFSSLMFLRNNSINNYRTQTLGNNLVPKKNITNTYNVSLSYIDIKKNLYSILSISHNTISKALGKTFTNNTFETSQQFNYLENQHSSSLIYSLEKKLYKMPYGLKFSSINTGIQNNSFLNGEKSNNTILQNQVTFGLKSYFKNSYFNFNAGVEYLASSTTNKTQNSVNKGKLSTYSPFLNIDGLILNKSINWSINSNYYYFQSDLFANTDVIDIGFNIIYKLSAHLKCNIHASNILNIRDNNQKNSILIDPVFVQQNRMNTLSGFLNLGLQYTY